MQDRYFSDEELVAYLDGEDDFVSMEEVAQALEQDDALVARLEALTLDKDALKAAFAELTPDSQAELPSAPVRPTRGLWAGVTGIAVAASLVLGFALGQAQQNRLDGWAEYVAAYQALYSTSTLAHIEVTPEVQQAELDRVSASIGKEIDVESLMLFPDVAYRRAQILSFEGQALIQLAFLTSTGEPIALCIIRGESADEVSLKLGQMEGLSSALWSQNGYEYILIGGQDEALIGRMSSAFRGMNI